MENSHARSLRREGLVLVAQDLERGVRRRAALQRLGRLEDTTVRGLRSRHVSRSLECSALLHVQREIDAPERGPNQVAISVDECPLRRGEWTGRERLPLGSRPLELLARLGEAALRQGSKRQVGADRLKIDLVVEFGRDIPDQTLPERTRLAEVVLGLRGVRAKESGSRT